jgi:hypothetical protein
LDAKRRILTANAFPPGCIVMLLDQTRKNKWEPKFVGPYHVVRRTRNGNLTLKDETGELLDRNIPPDQLKLVSIKPRESDLTSNVYEVERILAHRGSPGSYEFQIKWKNWRVPTWEPESNLRDLAIVQDYWNSQPT